ncbi:hypothetical protein, partial [Kosakonia quasisacchari]|uniref:hypothetical protein n=1 Tax=Kosakonia quasisacchari TaxID=2529380 RepID=UPI001ABB90F2
QLSEEAILTDGLFAFLRCDKSRPPYRFLTLICRTESLMRKHGAFLLKTVHAPILNCLHC